MITITTRSITKEESARYRKTQPGTYKRFESFVIRMLFIVFLGIIPMLVYDKYFPVTSATQFIYCTVLLCIAAIGTYRFTRRYVDKTDWSTAQVEEVKVKTNRAIRREDPEDFGTAFYMDVIHNGQHKTLYLWGQYLDELEEDQFPNTEFTFVRVAGSEQFIDFRLMGQYFKEEKTLPSFEDEVWKSGNYPVNGQLLEYGVDEVR